MTEDELSQHCERMHKGLVNGITVRVLLALAGVLLAIAASVAAMTGGKADRTDVDRLRQAQARSAETVGRQDERLKRIEDDVRYIRTKLDERN